MKRHKILACAVLFAVMMSAECSALQFGRYYQEADSQEMSPVEWLVLDETDDALLLITARCIDEIPYNERRANVKWDDCSLREWLNGEFLRTAFTSTERSAIITSGLPGKVFALSREEVIKYMPEEADRQCTPTAYSRSRVTYINGNGLCAWRTRTPAGNSQAVYLSSYGTFGNRPHYVDDNVIGVRPALWVSKRAVAGAVLYSVKPDSRKAYEAENTVFPMMKQEAPFDAKELHEYFFRNPHKALQEFDGKRIEAEGVVLRTGPDGVFGQPCIELSDRAGGKCYVLCIFQDAKAFSSVKAGDKVSVRGNYLVIREDYGIVLKASELV